MIQVDETTWQRLAEDFVFEAPQTIYLKGKGNTVVYRLSGPRTDAPAAAIKAELTA
jgi:adenylate cyclase